MTNKNLRESLTESLKQRPEQMQSTILNACKSQFGVIDSGFLCRSIGVLDPVDPIILKQGSSVSEAVKTLQKRNVGAALISDRPGKIVGIFSERDYLVKIHGKNLNEKEASVDDYMTKEPLTVTADSPIAYGLSLMSQGGFRHLPVVDDENHPIGIVTVRDVVDYIMESFTNDLLSLKLSDSD